ncbi:uncharacterized protein BDR25DRAFT_357603 [Lindgomyces ingoldianus]|uniref:Uncharacterized protein n=1 Tax=Lindgomyces ingoldianus TaxID=673940 RepID=A0ACB6QQE4_9PLEO|nr:uncharacterized protein BDR25DRAFT_357603 [Lindgomyces ingoldianus]KAF2468307.1 hypothetical protein BDR25DRAFT_357603 [Lindgomyces ingoldianus]
MPQFQQHFIQSRTYHAARGSHYAEFNPANRAPEDLMTKGRSTFSNASRCATSATRSALLSNIAFLEQGIFTKHLSEEWRLSIKPRVTAENMIVRQWYLSHTGCGNGGFPAAEHPHSADELTTLLALRLKCMTPGVDGYGRMKLCLKVEKVAAVASIPFKASEPVPARLIALSAVATMLRGRAAIMLEVSVAGYGLERSVSRVYPLVKSGAAWIADSPKPQGGPLSSVCDRESAIDTHHKAGWARPWMNSVEGIGRARVTEQDRRYNVATIDIRREQRTAMHDKDVHYPALSPKKDMRSVSHN